VLLLCASGCVTVYQPMVGLQRPVAVNPELANFQGLTLLVRCHESPEAQADLLCKKLRTVFNNQGATVGVEVVRPKTVPLDRPARPDLIIDIKSRKLAEENSFLLWLMFVASLTLSPAVTDATWAQDITIRDNEGFLLSQETWQSRFVRYTGLGAVLVTAIGDWLIRPKSEQLGGNVAAEEFSKDFYAQLSQLAFNARMRQTLTRSFDAPASSPPEKTP
jgi:hypothetical protein